MKNDQKLTPFQYMMENRKVIIKEIFDNKSIPKAWEIIKEKIPELPERIKLNTFKGYVKPLSILDKIIDENENLKNEKEQLTIELEKIKLENKSRKMELGKVKQEKVKVETEIGIVMQNLKDMKEKHGIEMERMKKKSCKVSQKSESKRDIDNDNIPKRIDGWGVQLKGNYYRLFKKIGGKVKWIHIGKKWDIKMVRKKIEACGG